MNRLIGSIIVLTIFLVLLRKGFHLYQFARGIQEDTPQFVESLLNNEAKNGDLIFQTSLSGQSKAIQLATKSQFSHMGIIYRINNKIFVYEAIETVCLTPIEKWIRRGEGGKFVIKRLIDSDRLLTEEVLNKMRLVGNKFLGKKYDLYFEWSDDKIYCSELVWKIYKEAAVIEIGEVEKLSSFDLSSNLVKVKMKERYGTNIPLEEKVITPAQMFNSNKLKTVIQN